MQATQEQPPTAARKSETVIDTTLDRNARHPAVLTYVATRFGAIPARVFGVAVIRLCDGTFRGGCQREGEA